MAADGHNGPRANRFQRADLLPPPQLSLMLVGTLSGHPITILRSFSWLELLRRATRAAGGAGGDAPGLSQRGAAGAACKTPRLPPGPRAGTRRRERYDGRLGGGGFAPAAQLRPRATNLARRRSRRARSISPGPTMPRPRTGSGSSAVRGRLQRVRQIATVGANVGAIRTRGSRRPRATATRCGPQHGRHVGLFEYRDGHDIHDTALSWPTRH